MTMEEIVRAHGHENVTARHESTFEVTTDDFLTPAGDCILGINADRAPADFDSSFIASCKAPDVTITATFRTPRHDHVICGRGHPELTFASHRSLVGRTSEYVDDRTVMVAADGASATMNPDLVADLAAGADLTLTLRVV